ncbi:MAG: hypothetical protein WKF84_15245 [Pyrinomonadaceae bacterium]
MYDLGVIDRLPRLSIIQAEGAAPLAELFANPGAREQRRIEDFSLNALATIKHPQTLATAIKIGSPVSWRKAVRSVLWTGGHVLSSDRAGDC